MAELEAEGKLVISDAFGIRITHHLWLDWGRIALRNLSQVRDARVKVLATRDAGGNWAADMEAEYAGALITISACAHALDAVYGALQDRVQLPRLADDASRHDHIRSALATAFTVGNDDGKRWKTEFSWLFDLRDAAVHHKEISRPTVPHPVEGHGSYEVGRYCLESCERAVALLADVLRLLGSAQRARTAEVRAYSETMTPAIADLLVDVGKLV